MGFMYPNILQLSNVKPQTGSPYLLLDLTSENIKEPSAQLQP